MIALLNVNKLKNISMTKNKNLNVSPYFLSWFRSFTDAECCFLVSLTKKILLLLNLRLNFI